MQDEKITIFGFDWIHWDSFELVSFSRRGPVAVGRGLELSALQTFDI